MDVTPEEVEKVMQKHNVARLIHGHTHRPAEHAFDAQRTRLVLSDWSERQGEYLSLDAQGWMRHPL